MGLGTDNRACSVILLCILSILQMCTAFPLYDICCADVEPPPGGGTLLKRHRQSNKQFSIPDLGTRSLFPGSLSTHFLYMDRYRSSAHFADFQVRSSLNRSKKTSGSLLEESAKTLDRS